MPINIFDIFKLADELIDLDEKHDASPNPKKKHDNKNTKKKPEHKQNSFNSIKKNININNKAIASSFENLKIAKPAEIPEINVSNFDFNMEDLKKAIILKEVLDKPLALR